MRLCKTQMAGVYLVESEVFEDTRGGFFRMFCKDTLAACDIDFNTHQVNFSYNKKKGTVRGMHMQLPPNAEAKLVRCINGSVLDVLVDLRKGSPTFLSYQCFELSKSNRRMLCIPKGIVHGFQTLEDDTELLYMHDANYNSSSEFSVNIHDPLVAISWPLEITEMSDKDLSVPFLPLDYAGVEL